MYFRNGHPRRPVVRTDRGNRQVLPGPLPPIPNQQQQLQPNSPQQMIVAGQMAEVLMTGIDGRSVERIFAAKGTPVSIDCGERLGTHLARALDLNDTQFNLATAVPLMSQYGWYLDGLHLAYVGPRSGQLLYSAQLQYGRHQNTFSSAQVGHWLGLDIADRPPLQYLGLSDNVVGTQENATAWVLFPPFTFAVDV